MGYPGSEGQSPNVQDSNSPGQGGGPSPQGGGPSPQGGGSSPQGGGTSRSPLPNGSEHVHETTKLANYLNHFLGQPMRNTGIQLDKVSPEHNPTLGRIMLHVRMDHPEYFGNKGIRSFSEMTVNEEFVYNIRGLEKDYPGFFPSRKNSTELLEIANSRRNN